MTSTFPETITTAKVTRRFLTQAHRILKDVTATKKNEEVTDTYSVMVSTRNSARQSAKIDPAPTEEDGSEQVQENEAVDIVKEEKAMTKSLDESREEEGSDDNNDVDNDDDGDDESENDNEETNKLLVMQSRRKSPFRNSDKKKKGNEKNALTHLIPGYTAPMKLDSSSLDKYRCGIKELGRRAERKDASTKGFVLEATAQKANRSMKKTKAGFLPKSYTAAYSHFKRGAKRAPDDTAGKGWFGMKPAAMTDSLKTDLAIIRNRTYLDPKRFYKSTDKHHSIVQVGTVIEGAAEFYSSRLTKRERRSNITEELMADKATLDYTKNKFKKMAQEKSYQAELRKNKPKKKARKFY